MRGDISAPPRSISGRPPLPLSPFPTPVRLRMTQHAGVRGAGAPHGQKGKRFEAVALKLNSLHDFINVGGMGQSKMEEVYKRLLVAHREKFANGEFKSGEREGVSSPTQYICNQIMGEEDGLQAAKTAKTEQAQEALANKEAKGKEVNSSLHTTLWF